MKHRKFRLDFARKYESWTVEEFKRVVWSDETKIGRMDSDDMQWTWGRPKTGIQDHRVQGTCKYCGGNRMLWGCMTWLGVGQSCKIGGNVASALYFEIPEDNSLGTIEHYGLDHSIF